MKYKKLILLLLFIPIVLAISIDSGTNYTIINIPNCIGNANVIVQPTNLIKFDEYLIKDCSRNSINEWSCQCKENFDILFQTNKTTDNIYDFIINYEVQQVKESGVITENNSNISVLAPIGAPTNEERMKEDAQRKIEVNNIKVIYTNEPFKFSIPEFSSEQITSVFIFVVLVIIIVFVGTIWLIRKFLFSSKEDTIQGVEEGISDKEIEQYLSQIK